MCSVFIIVFAGRVYASHPLFDIMKELLSESGGHVCSICIFLMAASYCVSQSPVDRLNTRGGVVLLILPHEQPLVHVLLLHVLIQFL